MADSSLRARVLRAAAALACCGAAGAGAAAGARAILPPPDGTARGLRIAGVEVPEGARPRDAAEEHARRLLGRRVRLTWDGAVLVEASLAELGATVDVGAVAAQAGRVGHEDGVLARVEAALEARRGAVDVPVPIRLPIEALAERLAEAKDDLDTPPRAARIDFATKTPTDHAPGRYLDVYAAATAIDRAVAAAARGRGAPPGGAIPVAIPAFEIAPQATRDVVARVDVSTVMARYETNFGHLGPQANRAQNIRRAASLVDGVVLMPGEIVSFNRLVGARSTDNGFAVAPEIYKGEMRDGVGGGTCQVSGTLHAAAFFGGLEIVERANHSRPSGYIRMGLDATVVYPTVDLKLRNSYAFPVVVHAVVEQSGKLAFELLGREKPATVELATATVGVAPFKRKVEEASWVKDGAFVVKQKGIRGYSIRKTRTIRLAGGGTRVEVTTDVYPPTFEIFQVAPGADVDAILPPPPEPDEGAEGAADGRTAANEVATAEPPRGAN